MGLFDETGRVGAWKWEESIVVYADEVKRDSYWFCGVEVRYWEAVVFYEHDHYYFEGEHVEIPYFWFEFIFGKDGADWIDV